METKDENNTPKITRGDAFAENKQALMDYMKSKKIEVVETEYDGSGDSGMVNGIYIVEVDVDTRKRDYTKSRKDIDSVDTIQFWKHQSKFVDTESGGKWQEVFSKEETLVKDAFEDFAYEVLNMEDIDWYNNDGGFGNVTFYANENRVTLEHNTRITETEYHESEF